MATHSSTLAWKIPWAEEPGGLQSMGLRRVGHGWATSLSLFTFMHWRRKWQPTPVFLPGESQGQGSLMGCRLGGCTESELRGQFDEGLVVCFFVLVFFFFCFALLCFAYLGMGIFTVLGEDQWCLSRTVKHETVWKQEWTEHSGFWSRVTRC